MPRYLHAMCTFGVPSAVLHVRVSLRRPRAVRGGCGSATSPTLRDFVSTESYSEHLTQHVDSHADINHFFHLSHCRKGKKIGVCPIVFVRHTSWGFALYAEQLCTILDSALRLLLRLHSRSQHSLKDCATVAMPKTRTDTGEAPENTRTYGSRVCGSSIPSRESQVHRVCAGVLSETATAVRSRT
jgi:hypothetical protein